MKKILVPIDFTTYSNNAFRLATYIARIKGMSIKLLHVIEEPAFAVFSKKDNSKYLDDMEFETREHLNRLVSLENANELEVEYEIRRSKTGIAKEILKEKCDLIIMGRRREDNDEGLMMGSVAEKIVRLSSVPVMTVSILPENYAIRKIVFASNFEEETISPVLQRVKDLSQIFNSELFFLYVMLNREFLSESQTEEKVKKITQNFDLTGHEVEIYFAPTVEEGIADYIDDAAPDLVVLCTHGRRGIAHFFIGSVAENMASYANVPVLTYNINAKKTEKSTQRISRGKMERNKTNQSVESR